MPGLANQLGESELGLLALPRRLRLFQCSQTAGNFGKLVDQGAARDLGWVCG